MRLVLAHSPSVWSWAKKVNLLVRCINKKGLLKEAFAK